MTYSAVITLAGSSVPVPEPLTLSMFAVGLAGTAAIRRRKKQERPKSGSIGESGGLPVFLSRAIFAESPRTSGRSANLRHQATRRQANACTHEQEVQARIAKMNGYTGVPNCN